MKKNRLAGVMFSVFLLVASQDLQASSIVFDVKSVASGAAMSTALGDLNGDGNLDMVLANDSNTVTVMLGAGDGTFGEPSYYRTGGKSWSVALGDLDGDGDLDIVVGTNSTGDATVSVLMGVGNGTFNAAAKYPAGGRSWSVALGDLDGDGDLDMAVANYDGNTVSILPGEGDGTFGPALTYAVGETAWSLALGDLDADGDLDMAVANYDGDTISVLLGLNDGTFAPPVDYAAGRAPGCVALGDLDGDGNLDMVIANAASATISVILGAGDGSFGSPANYRVGGAPYCVALGDLDGDGDLDMAVENFGNNVLSVLLGQGDGTFDVPLDHSVGGRPQSVALGDLDGDGDLDMAVDSWHDAVRVFINLWPKRILHECSYLGANRSSRPDEDNFFFIGKAGEEITIMLSPGGSPYKGNTAILEVMGNRRNRSRIYYKKAGILPHTITIVLPAEGQFQVLVSQYPQSTKRQRFEGNYCLRLESSGIAVDTFETGRLVE